MRSQRCSPFTTMGSSKLMASSQCWPVSFSCSRAARMRIVRRLCPPTLARDTVPFLHSEQPVDRPVVGQQQTLAVRDDHPLHEGIKEGAEDLDELLAIDHV